MNHQEQSSPGCSSACWRWWAPVPPRSGSHQAPTTAPLLTGRQQHPRRVELHRGPGAEHAQGKQTDYLEYQAPDRLGGYIQSGNRRTYVYVIGTYEYQSLTVAAGASTDAPGLLPASRAKVPSALDPAHSYLPYAAQAKQPSTVG